MKNNTSSYFTRLRFDVSAKDWILSVFSITPAVILFNYWLFGKQYFEDVEEFLIVTLSTIFAAILLWAILMHVMYAVRRKYPSLKQTWSRIKLSLLLYSTLTIAFSFIVMHIYDISGLYGFQYTHALFIKVVGICIIINLFSEGAYEFFYTFEKWKESLAEKEALQREKVQYDLAALKSRVNPHFLFNNLNTLSSLIEEDPLKAEDFLNEMSKVYRYLLRHHEVDLTTLESEIIFIRSYFYLLKTRYEDALQLTLNIDKKYNDYLIPPLTLHVLIENAITHNKIMKEKPLSIEIMTTPNGKLMVSNNVQEKDIMVATNKVDLSSIIEKYKLMNYQLVLVEKDERVYSVSIPLIKEKNATTKTGTTIHQKK